MLNAKLGRTLKQTQVRAHTHKHLVTYSYGHAGGKHPCATMCQGRKFMIRTDVPFLFRFYKAHTLGTLNSCICWTFMSPILAMSVAVATMVTVGVGTHCKVDPRKRNDIFICYNYECGYVPVRSLHCCICVFSLLFVAPPVPSAFPTHLLSLQSLGWHPVIIRGSTLVTCREVLPSRSSLPDGYTVTCTGTWGAKETG